MTKPGSYVLACKKSKHIFDSFETKSGKLYRKEVTKLQTYIKKSLKDWKYIKKTYLDHCQTSEVGRFEKMIND